jgi:hypothetical protein
VRGKLVRTILGVLIALGAAIGVLYFQWRGDLSRERAGLEIAQGFRAPTSSSVGFERVLRSWHPGDEVRWTARTESGCADQVRVTGAIVPPSTSEPSHRYELVVDVNTHQIAPGNELGRRAIEALTAPKPAASASAPASAPR